MGILARDDERIALPAHVVAGRSSACALRIGEPQVSAEHASLSHRDGRWVARDLGSRNGTFVNGERLDPGGARALAAGDRISFGEPSGGFTLVDASPPVAMARRLPGNELIAADGEILALPSQVCPLACVFRGEDGRFTLEVEGLSREVKDGDVVHAAGEAFVLHLPGDVLATAQAQERRPGVDEVEFRLRVSRNEETVEVSVAGPLLGEGARSLPPRTHHYTWLVLARARVRDEGAPGLASTQRGWVFVDDICRMLSIDENRLNVDIYRIRRDAESIGLANAPSVIERRRGSRQLRLGTARLLVTSLD
jgi:hypothetical protein